MSSASTRRLIPKARRFSLHLACALWFLSVSFALLVATACSAGPGDSESEEGAKDDRFDEEFTPLDKQFYRMLGFETYPDMTPAQLRRLQERKLPLKIAIVDRVCGLTDFQKEKLRLAGHGDIRQQFDQIEEFCRRFQLVKNDPEKLRALSDEVRPLRAMHRLGLSDGDVLFGKTLKTLLTAEQRAKYEPLRAAVSAGGAVEMSQYKSSTLLRIRGGWSRIVDDDLATFSQLTDLTGLSLEATQVTDAGLVHLTGMQNLGSLSLAGTIVTDAGLVHLKGIKNLESLSLAGTKLTGAGLAHLSALKNLKSLSLDGTQVTDTGLVHLTALATLEHLSLQKTPVTDAGLAHLKRLTRLRNLQLDDTEISDAGLAHLKEMTSLRQSHFDRTRVTPAGTADLKKALPDLRFDR